MAGASAGSAASMVSQAGKRPTAFEADHEPDNLGARIASALVLGPAAVASAVAGGPWIAGAAGAAVVAMSYEWARMSEPKQHIPAFTFCLAGALGAVMLASRDLAVWGMLWLVLVGAASALRRRSLIGAAETVGGVAYIGLPCIAFLWLRGHSGWGLQAILVLFGIIWSADSAAYFGGRFLGGPRLAPNISPQKTWAGLLAGCVAGGTSGAVCARIFDGQVWLWLVTGVALAAIGLGGDLFESAIKRRFGVKDASRLIPGHGGVLDRIDGLMAAVSVMALGVGVFPGLIQSLFYARGP